MEAALYKPSFERSRTCARVSFTRSAPSLNTVTKRSLEGSPWPPVMVVSFPSRTSRVNLPCFDFLPGSVIGSLTTLTPAPSTKACEHLKAHFCVSRCSFCSKAPPLPKAKLSAAQPLSFMAWRIISRLVMSMPSPWMTRMYGGNNLCPVDVFVEPNLPSSVWRTCSTVPGNSPLSGRTTSTPSRRSMVPFNSVPQYCAQALKMSKLSLTQATMPLGYLSNMFRIARHSPSRPQLVIVLCSEAGMEKPAAASE
mmetsp:Transcript_89202/g.257164  ORF Transcript_89202/g.257164 Transcript_89202/m.257164 type:complete len:252 (-) Transcript_89202:472-1227(-)